MLFTAEYIRSDILVMIMLKFNTFFFFFYFSWKLGSHLGSIDVHICGLSIFIECTNVILAIHLHVWLINTLFAVFDLGILWMLKRNQRTVPFLQVTPGIITPCALLSGMNSMKIVFNPKTNWLSLLFHKIYLDI